jgi:hypothetical protein
VNVAPWLTAPPSIVEPGELLERDKKRGRK